MCRLGLLKKAYSPDRTFATINASQRIKIKKQYGLLFILPLLQQQKALRSKDENERLSSKECP